jgi:hypothetical protein
MITERTELSQIELKADSNGFFHTLFLENNTMVLKEGMVIAETNHREPIEPSSDAGLMALAVAILSSDIDIAKLKTMLESMNGVFVKPNRIYADNLVE